MDGEWVAINDILTVLESTRAKSSIIGNAIDKEAETGSRSTSISIVASDNGFKVSENSCYCL